MRVVYFYVVFLTVRDIIYLQITTRDFYIESAQEGDEVGDKILAPVADLINHADQPNVWRWGEFSLTLLLLIL